MARPPPWSSAKVFFPEAGGFVATLAAFGTFAVGFLARPLGGVFFGGLGDRRGRKSTLLITLTVMGLSTIGIGLLPGYQSIGAWAPVLLVLPRLLQGFAVGGEWGGSMIIVLESAPPRRRGFFSAWPNTGGFSAQLLITLVFAYVYTLDDARLYAWGWRVPFLLAAVILVVTFWMRQSLRESPVFQQAVVAPAEGAGSPAPSTPGSDDSRTPGQGRGPIRATFIQDWPNLVLLLGLRFAESVPYFLLTVFALSYGGKTLGLDKTLLNNAILIVSVLAFAAHGLFAALWRPDRPAAGIPLRRRRGVPDRLPILRAAAHRVVRVNPAWLRAGAQRRTQRDQRDPAGLLRRAVPR
jgi:MFS transporter, MHS family, shikimate and dehydroshikimate transport protein